MNLGRKTAAALLCAVVIFSGAAAAKGEESPGISAVSAVGCGQPNTALQQGMRKAYACSKHYENHDGAGGAGKLRS